MTGDRLRLSIATMCVAAASSLAAASNAAAVGPLTFSECFGDIPDSACKALTGGLLDGATDVVVSPRDGDVYAVSVNTDSIAHFKRSADGSLAFADCISDSAGLGCTDPPGSPLNAAGNLAIAPDGEQLYVTGIATLTTLSISPTGALAYQSCFGDTAATTCLDLPGEPFDTASDVALTPSGNALYTTSHQGNLVTRFTIDSLGYPSYQGCYGSTNSDGCVDLPGTPLGIARSAVVSPDGGDLYVTGFSGYLTHFTIGAGGALTFQGCDSNGPSSPCTDVPGSPIGLPYGVEVSPDGSAVYVASASDAGTVSRFTTDSAGAPTFADCLGGDPSTGCAATSTPALRSVHHLLLSGDGSTLYASSPYGSIAQFSVGAGGGLTFASCVSDGATAGCIDLPGAPLALPERIALSNDERSLYVASYTGGGLTSLLTSPPPDTVAPETTIGKQPKRKSKKRKAKFTFSSSEPGSTFTCALDKKAARECSSPYEVRVRPGKHRMTIAAVDVAGNVDASPATAKWKVKRKPRKQG